MDETLLHPLNKLEASLNALVQSLVTTNTFSAAPKAAKDLIAADDELTSALVTLKRHQDNYAEIIRLRAEADALNQNIKDTIRTCVTLRNELGDIHPSVLEDDDEEEDSEMETEKEKYNAVDYDTLLAFAFRIGKHNAIARKDAEREAESADIEARKQREQKDQDQNNKSNDKNPASAPTVPNGPHAEDTTPTTTAAAMQAAASTGPTEQGAGAEAGATTPPSQQQNDLRTQQVQNVLRQMRHLQRITHMEQSAPYPNANLLRVGELGRIHYLRELEGEQAADRMVEDMVKKAELKYADEEEEEATSSLGRDSPEKSRHDRQAAAASSMRPQQQQQQQQQQRPAAERKPKKAFDVDFPGGGDDDDDDEDDEDD